MESVVRGALVYGFVWLIFRIAGKRTMAEATTFDLVLLLIISETIQEAMIDTDHSMTNGFLLIITLIGLDILLSLWKRSSHRMEKVMDGVPVVIVENGKPIKDRMYKLRVDDDDVMTAARQSQGLERMEQIKYAVLERSGSISIIPKAEEK